MTFYCHFCGLIFKKGPYFVKRLKGHLKIHNGIIMADKLGPIEILEI